MSVEQGEHTFTQDVLISGEELRGYSAEEALTQGEPVAVTGDYAVSAASDGGPFIGVALYDVAAGEEVAIGSSDCEVRVEVSEAITAEAALVPDGAGAFRQADETNNGETGNVLAQTGAGAGEVLEGYIYAITGVTL